MKLAKPPALALALVLGAFVPAVHAQDAPAASPPESAVRWLTGYRFHLTAAAIGSDDPRFDWRARFGGDVDLVDYGAGRLNMLADYMVVVGSEHRTVDPNQGVYHLALSTSWRPGPLEVRAVFDHVSRHLSDRDNPDAVAWNEAGAAATLRRAAGPVTATVKLYGAKVVQSAFVDYTWQFDAGVEATYTISPAVSLIGRGNLAPTLMDAAIAGRNAETAGRIEAGVRLRGSRAAVEFFAAWERVLDPYPVERQVRSWGLVGFRLIGG
jgi:hypothetical protein